MLTKNTGELFTTVARHIAADAVVQGEYWKNGRGCFIGCLAHSSCAETLTIKYGIPVPLVRVLERIFESLNAIEAQQFFADIPAAIAIDGKDLRPVVWQFLAETLRALPVETEGTRAVIVGLALLGQGGEWPEAAASATWDAASAARAASATAEAAWATARAARAARAASAASAAESRRQRDSVLRLIAAAPRQHTHPTPEPPNAD